MADFVIHLFLTIYPLGLEKGMATHSSICARRIPWAELVWRAAILGVTESQTCLSEWLTNTHTHTHTPFRIKIIWGRLLLQTSSKLRVFPFDLMYMLKVKYLENENNFPTAFLL